MSRAVLMSAISVVVKWTVLSSATGMFIRIKRCRTNTDKRCISFYISFIYLFIYFISCYFFLYLFISFHLFYMKRGMNKYLQHLPTGASELVINRRVALGNFYLPKEQKRNTLVFKVIFKRKSWGCLIFFLLDSTPATSFLDVLKYLPESDLYLHWENRQVFM